ncbi:MAG: hypothetical protein HN348_17820 [Proteobacteria bacterium]|jgi:hypothetical protein|nr:hypothetical protein [Pseudomonadota bacterium]
MEIVSHTTMSTDEIAMAAMCLVFGGEPGGWGRVVVWDAVGFVVCM